jgi:2-haloacid dehalogenase
MTDISAILFDAYGTLFDLRSAVVRHEAQLGGKADRISALWRQKQLEYTWTLSLRGDYRDFAAITRDALDYALAMEGFRDEAVAEALMEAFLDLDPYPDAEATLRALQRRGLHLGILSNGTPAMLARLMARVPFGDVLSPVLSVDPLKVYKPDRRVYRLGCDALALPPERVGFVSANAWDAAGAAGFGFRVFWINRAKAPIEYELAERVTVVTALGALSEMPF